MRETDNIGNEIVFKEVTEVVLVLGEEECASLARDDELGWMVRFKPKIQYGHRIIEAVYEKQKELNKRDGFEI